MSPGIEKKCPSPGCTSPATRTYRGPHGNKVDLCRTCYYKKVTGPPTGGLNSPSVPGPTPPKPPDPSDKSEQ